MPFSIIVLSLIVVRITPSQDQKSHELTNHRLTSQCSYRPHQPQARQHHLHRRKPRGGTIRHIDGGPTSIIMYFTAYILPTPFGELATNGADLPILLPGHCRMSLWHRLRRQSRLSSAAVSGAERKFVRRGEKHCGFIGRNA